ncbi:MAG: hypothetical protein Q8R18_01870 [bacterium]|nr:hypothetical protein [bacterium]
MKKRAQILGLPLILVFSLIVGAFILLYGAKVILDLTEEADYVDFLGQVEDLDATLDTFGNYDIGSSKVYTLKVPEDVEIICFYDASQGDSCRLDGDACSSDIEGKLALVLDEEYNLYIFPQGLYDRNRFTIEKFQTEEGNPLCISNGNSLLVQSQKDYVGISYYEK